MPTVIRRWRSHVTSAPTCACSTSARPVEPLTDREEEVLVAVARSRTNGEIADERYISLSTAKTYLASLMRKLGAPNRVELALWPYGTDRTRTR